MTCDGQHLDPDACRIIDGMSPVELRMLQAIGVALGPGLAARADEGRPGSEWVAGAAGVVDEACRPLGDPPSPAGLASRAEAA